MRFHQDDRAVRYCDLFDVMKEEDFDQSSRKTVEAVNTWYSR